jgi:hypothetical protein
VIGLTFSQSRKAMRRQGVRRTLVVQSWHSELALDE